MTLSRRKWLHAAAGITALGVANAQSNTTQAPRTFNPQPQGWRTFELTTEVEILDVQGGTKIWLPLPDLQTTYQESLDHSWTGTASRAQVVSDPTKQVRMVYAEFAESLKSPRFVLKSRFKTSNRATSWDRTDNVRTLQTELKPHLRATELLPTDGIVRATALRITQGAVSDVEKVRAIYHWVIQNAHREPKTKGCGTGDIRAMLETGNLSGKCADLNALFVGLCRSCGVPARDVYGVRLAPSAFGYRELGANASRLQGAQHCRAEVWLAQYGWVPMDPADVLKVMRQESPDWIKDPNHPLIAPVVRGLFGNWEGNWVGFNTGHDIALPNSSSRAPIGFLMYPNGENASGRFDELSPDTFKYVMSATEISS